MRFPTNIRNMKTDVSILWISFVVFFCLFELGDAGYCVESYTCLDRCSRSTSYKKGCGWFRKCTKYKAVYYSCTKVCKKQVCCSGYTGPSCSTPLCFGSTSCPNNGRCVSPNKCICTTGYVGQKCTDALECRKNNGGCQHICTNTVGSFRCSCKPGYVLNTDQRTCKDIDECRSNNGDCSHLCENLPGTHRCKCRAGYELESDKRRCKDIDECKTGAARCNQKCYNIAGSFKCSCNPGYKLQINGITCEDIDECVEGTHGCQQLCTNTPGSFKCSCSEGFEIAPDLKTCREIMLCGTPAANCSQICIDSPGSFTCDCRSGFNLQPDGVTCLDIDECRERTSGCSQSCTNTEGSFKCSCTDGYTLDQDGRTCKDIDDCLGVTCSNGGTCADGFKSYTCRCATGFTGTHCEKDINECSVLNGGCQDVCNNELGSFTCSCTGNTTLADDGLTCKGQTANASVFRRHGILGRILPRGCFTLNLTSCTDGEDIAVRLSSTSNWFISNSNTSVTFSPGIVFVEVNNLAIPISLSGVTVIIQNGQFSINLGSNGLTPSDGSTTGSRRSSKCFALDFTPADLVEFISSNSFLKSVFDRLFSVLPNFLQLSGVNSSIINVNNLRTDLVYGRDMAGVEDCSGAPVLDNHLYSVFRFATNFELSLYGNNINIPKPLQNKQFCLIVDVCQKYGGTVFLMVPENSNGLLAQLKIFQQLQENQGLTILPRGIGLSVVNGINVKNFETELQLWNGDQFITYPIFERGDLWFGGRIIKDSQSFRIEAEVDAFISIPRLDRILTGVFVDEWNALLHAEDISPTIRFKLFKKDFSINLEKIIDTNIDVYMSIGGTGERKICGNTAFPEKANPPGLYTSALVTINPFKGVPILGDWLIKNPHTLYAYFTTDSKISNDTKIDIVEDIFELQNVIDRFNAFLKETLDAVDSLKTDIREDIKRIQYTLNAMKDFIVDSLDELVDGNIQDIITNLPMLWRYFREIGFTAKSMLDKIKLFFIDVKDGFISHIQSELKNIRQNIANTVEKLTGQVTSAVSNYDSFGLKYTTSISVLNLNIGEIDIEIVISQNVVARCSRFEKAFKLLEGQKAVRVLGRLAKETKLGFFLKVKKGLGLGGAFGVDSKEFVIQLTAYARMLGFSATTDVFLSKKGIYFYLEGNLWDIFLVQVDVSATVGNQWYKLTYNLSGRFVAKARRKRQTQTVSKSFQASYLDGLIKATKRLKDEVDKRLSKVQDAFTKAQGGLSKAQNWLDKKKEQVKSANAAFDKAVAALDKAKDKLEKAKGPFEKALSKLSAAQKKVDNLCKIKSCSKICIPGIKCKICKKKIGWVKIPYPCCKFTKCMISLPNPLCVAANLLCRAVRAIAFLALEAAKLLVRAPMIALDIAKGLVSVAQIVVDKSRLVLVIAEGALELAKGGLSVAKGVLEVAKGAIDAVKYVVRGALTILNLVIKYGLQNILDVRNCGFNIELSTTDLPIFDVSCEVNAFKLGWKKIQIRIDFRNILQSLWNAAKATIQNFVNVFKNIFSGRRRRDIAFESSSKVIRLIRSITSDGSFTFNETFRNETIEDIFNVVNSTRGMDESIMNTYESRTKLFREKCNVVSDVETFLMDAFGSLFDIANESKKSIDEARNITADLDRYNTENLIKSLTLENAGVNKDYAFDVYNLTNDDLDKAVEDSKTSIHSDPLAKELLSVKQFSSQSIKSEIENVETLSLIDEWILAMENATLNYFNEDECSGFKDCVLFAFESLYGIYEVEDGIPNVKLIKKLIMNLEEDVIFLFENTSTAANDIFDITKSIVGNIEELQTLNVYCSEAPRFISVLSNKTAVVGTTVSFKCDVESNPEANITWFKDGENIVGEASVKLTLSNVTEDDAGQYKCVAENVVANLSSEEVYLIVLQVNDVCNGSVAAANIDDGNCRSYIACTDKGFIEMCCRAGREFDPSSGVCAPTNIIQCIQTECPGNHTEECRLEAVEEDETSFIDLDANPSVTQPCAPGTVFRPDLCTCGHADGSNSVSTDTEEFEPCEKEIWVKFDGPQQAWSVKNYGDGWVSVQGGIQKQTDDNGESYGVFSGTNSLIVWRYANVAFQHLTMRIDFYPLASSDTKEILVTNCRTTGQTTPSLEVSLYPATSVIVVNAEVETGGVQLSLLYQVGARNTLTVIYDGEYIHASVETESANEYKNNKASGQILPGEALWVGSCTSYSQIGLVGDVYDFQFSRCVDKPMLQRMRNQP